MAKKAGKKAVQFKKATRRRPVAESDRLLVQQLRAAIEADGRPWGIIADECGISRSVLQRFMAGENDLTLSNASLVAEGIGLQLKP